MAQPGVSTSAPPRVIVFFGFMFRVLLVLDQDECPTRRSSAIAIVLLADH
jgi:hypothetical protein